MKGIFNKAVAGVLSVAMLAAMTALPGVNRNAAEALEDDSGAMVLTGASDDYDSGIVAKWTMGPDGYDDGVAMNGASGGDKSQKMLNGDRFVRYDNHGVKNIRTALPVGSYYFKFLVKIKRGTGSVNEGDRPFFVRIPGYEERTDRSGPILSSFPDNEWVTVSIPFVINNTLAGRDLEYDIKGAMPSVVGGNNAEVYIGREIVVSTNNSAMTYQGVVASYAMQGGYGDVTAVKGTLNDDRSRTYTGQDTMYQFKASLPEGKYWIKMMTKTSGKNTGANLSGAISSFSSSAGWSADLPALNEYTDGKWTNVMIPLTISAADADKPITYSVAGPQNGAKDLTIEEYILICDNDTPLPPAQEEWNERLIPAGFMANGYGVNQQNWGGNRKAFDPRDGYLELTSNLNSDRFIWDINMPLSRKQFVNQGYMSAGKVYVKVVAKVPTIAPEAQKGSGVLNIEMRRGGDVVAQKQINYGEFTTANEYQTFVCEFDTGTNFGGNGEWTVRFDARYLGGVSDLHVKAITVSPNSAIDKFLETDPAPQEMTWPEDQQLPSFGEPAWTLELVDVRDGTDTMWRSAMSALQGIVNKKQPRILVCESQEEAEGNGYRESNKDYWPASLGLNYVHAQGSSTNVRIARMIAKYKDEFSGFILYAGASNNYNDLNVATTIGGIYNAIPVTQSILNLLRSNPYNLDAANWPVIRDISGENFGSGTTNSLIGASRVAAYTYLYDNYSPANAAAKGNLPYNDRVITIINPGDNGGDNDSYRNGHFAIRDFAVATASPVVWLDARTTTTYRPQRELVSKFYADMRDAHNNGLGAIGMGFWPTEEQGVKLATSFGITTVPSDNFENYTVYAGMSRELDPPSVPKKPDLVGGINYISGATSDGDNIAYLQHGMRYGQRWGDRTRGGFPMNWTMTPALLDAAPQFLQYYFNSATDNDMLIIGPDGYGYTRSEDWPVTDVTLENGETANWIQGFAALNNKYMEKTALNYPTIWGQVISSNGVLNGTNFNTLSQAKFDFFADFEYFPSLAGLYYLNPTVRTSTVPGQNQNLTTENSTVRGQWFNFSYYAMDGDGAGGIGNTDSPASDNYTGTVYGRIKGLPQDLETSENTFSAFQMMNWVGDMIPKINAIQHYSNTNFPKNVFLRADHYFMLLAENNGEPINNALQADTFASASDFGFSSGRVVDGSFGKTHGWASSEKDENQWVAVDFGKRQDISRYVVKNAELAGYDANLNTKAWMFQVSNDRENWVTLDTVTNNTDATVYRNVDAEGKKYRYARILVTNAGADGVSRIQDIEVYGVNNWDKETLSYSTYTDVLDTAISAVASLERGDYSGSQWNAIQAAKTAAQALKEKSDGTSLTAAQVEIDEAAALINKLATEGILDKSVLAEKLDEANTLHDAAVEGDDEGKYETGSKAAFKTAINAAKAVYDSVAEDIEQSDIDDAVAALESAIATFEGSKLGPVDKSVLTAKIQQAETLISGKTDGENIGQYKNNAVATLRAAIDAAKAVEADGSIKVQKTVNEAVTTLESAITAFENAEIVAGLNYTALDTAIANAEALISGKSDAVAGQEEIGQYKNNAVKTLKDAIDAAKAVKINTQVTQQSVIDSAANTLSAAVTVFGNAEVVTNLNLDNLNTVIEKAQEVHDSSIEGTENGMYEAGAKSALRTAINKAITAKGAVKQTDVNAAADELYAALDIFASKYITKNEETNIAAIGLPQYSELVIDVISDAAEKEKINEALPKNQDGYDYAELISFDISVWLLGTDISDMLGNEVTVRIPYSAFGGEAGNIYKVFYVDDNGAAYGMECSPVETDEGLFLEFVTGHFSVYTVAQAVEIQKDESTPGTDESTPGTGESQKPAASNPNTGETGEFVFFALALTIAAASGLLIIRKRNRT